MKIIAGVWKGIHLKPPPLHLSRPTQERVKKSIFDILGLRVKEGRVLDLFAGSGSLGIEALSRGAKEVAFVEWNPLCMRVLKENLLKLPGKKELLCMEENAFKAIGKLASQKRCFDIVFMDPPYTKGVTTKCLRTVTQCGILNPTAMLVVRHSRKEELPSESGNFILLRHERYGETVVSFYGLAG